VRAGAASHQAVLAGVRGTPIGFVPAYQPVAFHVAGWWRDEHDPGARGIDQWLAEAEPRGQGLGTAMVRAFVACRFVDRAVAGGHARADRSTPEQPPADPLRREGRLPLGARGRHPGRPRVVDVRGSSRHRR
jgi:hypothetical protein